MSYEFMLLSKQLLNPVWINYGLVIINCFVTHKPK